MRRSKSLLLLLKKKSNAIIPSFSNATIAKQNTTATNKGGADQYGWSQSYSFVVDQNGNPFALHQETNSGTTTHRFVYANSNVWADNTLTEGFLARGSVALDRANNIAHVLWSAGATSDGIIYRRYTKNGSNTITGFTKDTNVNLQLDFNASAYEHPVILHIPGDSTNQFGTYGAIIALWSVRNGSSNQIRASLCILGETADRGKTAANWQALTTASSSHIGNQPAVTYSVLEENTNVAIMWPSIGALSTRDLALFYYDGGNQVKVIYKRIRWDGANRDWRTGPTTALEIANMRRAGNDLGYNLKFQLGSKVVEDADGNIWFGFANWKSDVAGDTVSIVSVKNDVASSIIDVYSANGAHSYAPCLDIDTWGKYVIVSYIATTTQYIYLAAYKGTQQVTAPTLIFNGAPCDIPLIEVFGNKIYTLFRDTVNTPTPPYSGWAGTIDI